MSKIITAVMLALAMALASPAYAVATWEHFNADPAYHSREAAIADAPRVLRQAGYPEPVISLLTEAMKNPGTEAHVTNGMKLDFMRSGKSALWRNVVVKFEKPPLKESMEYSAPSEEWTVEWNGGKWTVGIPKVCNNIYGKRPYSPTPKPPVSLPPPAAAPPAKQLVPTPTAECPKGIVLFANAWDWDTFPPDLQKRAEELNELATTRDSQNASNADAYRGDAFSRTLGNEVVRRVGVRASIGEVVQAQLLDPSSLNVVADLGAFQFVGGIATIPLTAGQRSYIVQTIWPSYFKSPTVSGGERRIWLFPNEWEGKSGGRLWCSKHVNGYFKEINKP